MREGVPQGGVIYPTLFLIYINDITNTIPRQVSNTLHTDDLAVWSASEHTTTAAYRIQESVKKIHQWTDDWGLEINRVKTMSTVFSLCTSKEKVQLKLKALGNQMGSKLQDLEDSLHRGSQTGTGVCVQLLEHSSQNQQGQTRQGPKPWTMNNPGYNENHSH